MYCIVMVVMYRFRCASVAVILIPGNLYFNMKIQTHHDLK